MEQVIQESIDRTFQSLDQGITGHKAYHNLGVIYEQMGRFRDAENCWQQSIQLCPAFSVSWLALARLYLKTGHPDAADDLHIRMKDSCQDSSTQAIIRGLILEFLGQAETAGEVLQQEFESTACMNCLDEAARIYLEHGLFERCQFVLKRLQQLDPRNSSVLHNLATAFEATSHYRDAISCLRESLSIRPQNPAAQMQLARLLQCVEQVDGGKA